MIEMKKKEEKDKLSLRGIFSLIFTFFAGGCLLSFAFLNKNNHELTTAFRFLTGLVGILYALYAYFQKPSNKEELEEDPYYLFNGFTRAKIIMTIFGIVLFFVGLGIL